MECLNSFQTQLSGTTEKKMSFNTYNASMENLCFLVLLIMSPFGQMFSVGLGLKVLFVGAVFQAVKQLKYRDFMKDFWVWLYRGSWQEWVLMKYKWQCHELGSGIRESTWNF